MNIFQKIQNWFRPRKQLAPEIIEEDWGNRPVTKRHLCQQALGARHELMLYLRFEAPIKYLLGSFDLMHVPVHGLIEMFAMNVFIDPITFEPKFKFMQYTFAMTEHQNIYKEMHPIIMGYIKTISEFEQMADAHID